MDEAASRVLDLGQRNPCLDKIYWTHFFPLLGGADPSFVLYHCKISNFLNYLLDE